MFTPEVVTNMSLASFLFAILLLIRKTLELISH